MSCTAVRFNCLIKVYHTRICGASTIFDIVGLLYHNTESFLAKKCVKPVRFNEKPEADFFSLRSVSGPISLFLPLCGQDAAQIIDRMARTFDRALPAREAVRLVDVREVVRHGDGPGRADLLADAAADAADLAHFARVLARVAVGAFDNDGVGAFVDADELARAFAHALAAGDALVFADLGHAVVVEGDGLKLAHIHAQLAADAAVLAVSRGAAAAVAGDEGRLIRKAFFDGHGYFPFLSYGVLQSGSFVRRSPS